MLFNANVSPECQPGAFGHVSFCPHPLQFQWLGSIVLCALWSRTWDQQQTLERKKEKIYLTLSLPPCRLKMTNKIAKFEIIKPYFLSHERISLKRHSVKSKLVPESYEAVKPTIICGNGNRWGNLLRSDGIACLSLLLQLLNHLATVQTRSYWWVQYCLTFESPGDCANNKKLQMNTILLSFWIAWWLCKQNQVTGKYNTA